MKQQSFSINIRGIGAYIPPKTIDNSKLEEIVDTTDQWIQQKIGVRTRHIALDESVEFMGVQAAKKCIELGNIQLSDIDMVLSSSISYKFKIPPLSNKIAHELGIKGKLCLDINAGGCCNFLATIMTASKYIDGINIKRILCVVSDKNSDFINWNDRSTCVIFGDGAAAAVLEIGEEGSGILYESLQGKYSEALLLPTAQAGREEDYLKMDGRGIFDFAVKMGTKSLKEMFNKLKITPEAVNHFIFHQANINIVENIIRECKIPEDKVPITLDKYGNTAGPSIGITLYENVKKGIIKRGDILVLSAFGGGLNWGCVVLKW